MNSCPPGQRSPDHRATVTTISLAADQITVELCPLPLESPPVPGLDPARSVFIDFDLTLAAARILAQTLLEAAEAADVKAAIDADAVAIGLLASCEEADDPSWSADAMLDP